MGLQRNLPPPADLLKRATRPHVRLKQLLNLQDKDVPNTGKLAKPVTLIRKLPPNRMQKPFPPI